MFQSLLPVSAFEIFNPEIDDVDSDDNNDDNDDDDDHSSSDSSQESVVSAPNKSENEKLERLTRGSVSIDDPSQPGEGKARRGGEGGKRKEK
jgi:hypothetical protein